MATGLARCRPFRCQCAGLLIVKQLTTALLALAQLAAYFFSGLRALGSASLDWKRGHSGIRRKIGSAMRRDRASFTGTTCESPGARTPWPWVRTTAAKESVADQSIGPHLRHDSILRIFVSTAKMAWASTGPCLTAI